MMEFDKNGDTARKVYFTRINKGQYEKFLRGFLARLSNRSKRQIYARRNGKFGFD